MDNIRLVSYTEEEYNFVYKVKKNAYKKYVEQNYGELLDNGNYEMENICIIPEDQRKGIETKLVKDILEKYKEYNIEIQYFKSNPVGVLYKRPGFIQNGESKFHYKMIKPKIESSTKIIYFVHGTTTDNAEKLCSGWKEAMLNELGKEQAKNLGNVIREKRIKFDVLITSDLQRAIESSNIAFPEDVEDRIREFIKFLKENYSGKTVGVVAHRAPQLALEVITKNITWEEAIKKDWRKTGDWKPGWEYIIK